MSCKISTFQRLIEFNRNQITVPFELVRLWLVGGDLTVCMRERVNYISEPFVDLLSSRLIYSIVIYLFALDSERSISQLQLYYAAYIHTYFSDVRIAFFFIFASFSCLLLSRAFIAFVPDSILFYVMKELCAHNSFNRKRTWHCLPDCVPKYVDSAVFFDL